MAAAKTSALRPSIFAHIQGKFHHERKVIGSFLKQFRPRFIARERFIANKGF